MIRCLGHEHSDEEIEKIFNAVDDDGGGTLSFAEFADVLTDLTQSETSILIKERVSELRDLFNLFDQVNNRMTSFAACTTLQLQATLANPLS